MKTYLIEYIISDVLRTFTVEAANRHQAEDMAKRYIYEKYGEVKLGGIARIVS